jgi:hypothetical protein
MSQMSRLGIAKAFADSETTEEIIGSIRWVGTPSARSIVAHNRPHIVVYGLRGLDTVPLAGGVRKSKGSREQMVFHRR